MAIGEAHRAVVASPSRIRLTIRGRRIVVAAVLGAVVIGLWLTLVGPLAGAAVERLAMPTPEATREVVVLPGDTLWEIAQTVQPDADPRDTVVVIRELNKLPDSGVRAGQRLVVPASP